MTNKPIPMQQGDEAPGPGCFLPLVRSKGDRQVCGELGPSWREIADRVEGQGWSTTPKALRAIDATLREAAKGRPLQVGDKVLVGDAEAVLYHIDTAICTVEWPSKTLSWLPLAAVRRAGDE